MRNIWVLALLLGAPIGTAAQTPAPAGIGDALRLAQEAADARSGGNAAGALAAAEKAAARRPDVPRILTELASAQLAAEKTAEAVETLQRLAALGAGPPFDDSDELRAFRAKPEAGDLVKSFTANTRPRGAGEIAFTLREVTGLIEGIAWREKTGEFYFGDVHGRSVWKRKKDGTLQRVTAESDELPGVFGLALDEGTGTLWAATSAVSPMRGYTEDMQGVAGVAEIDLESGALRRTVLVPAANGARHVIGDLALADDGTIFATDTADPAVWVLPSGAAALQSFATSGEFISPQGIVAMADALIVADRVNGLVRIGRSDRSIRRFDVPDGVTLTGLEGLVLTPTGELLALQPGLHPPRVLRIRLSADRESIEDVSVVESGHLTMAAPSLGCLGPDGDLYFVGNPGWTRFSRGSDAPAPRPVPIFRSKLARKK